MKSAKPAPDRSRSKVCKNCGVEKLRSNFSDDQRARDGLQARCKPCVAEASKARYQKHKDKILAKLSERYAKDKDALNERYRKSKLEAMRHYCYGEPYCVGCGVTNLEVLTIDHVDEDGAEHRKHVRTNRLGEWLRRAGYPEGYQVLCWNCNNAKHRHRKVPTYTYKEGFTPSIQFPKEFTNESV